MADYIFQVRLQGTSNLQEDVYENVLCFEVNAPDTVAGRCDEIKELYRTATFLGGFNSVEVRAYALTGGQPVAASGPTAKTGGATPALPNEVALCLSYAAVDDPAVSTRRRRGRIFLGPLFGTSAAGVRPNTTLRGLALTFGQSLASVGTAGNTTWKLFSRVDNVTAKIESIWVDDAWDIQRRRGLKPSARDIQDVQ